MNTKQLIVEDYKSFVCYANVKRIEQTNFSLTGCFKLFVREAIFRRTIAYRLSFSKSLFARILSKMICFETRFLCCNIPCRRIGKGLFLMHGFSTILNAKSIGDYCLFCHNVTLGWNSTGEPTIGNNVKVFTGAKILGGVQIADNVIVGANAVVVNDIPGNCVVAGVPAKIIKRLD